jgi:hypothetical protein
MKYFSTYISVFLDSRLRGNDSAVPIGFRFKNERESGGLCVSMFKKEAIIMVLAFIALILLGWLSSFIIPMFLK